MTKIYPSLEIDTISILFFVWSVITNINWKFMTKCFFFFIPIIFVFYQIGRKERSVSGRKYVFTYLVLNPKMGFYFYCSSTNSWLVSASTDTLMVQLVVEKRGKSALRFYSLFFQEKKWKKKKFVTYSFG